MLRYDRLYYALVGFGMAFSSIISLYTSMPYLFVALSILLGILSALLTYYSEAQKIRQKLLDFDEQAKNFEEIFRLQQELKRKDQRGKQNIEMTIRESLQFAVLSLYGEGNLPRRANIMFLNPKTRKLEMRYRFGYDGFPDFDLEIPEGQGVSGEAYEKNKQIFGFRSQGLAKKEMEKLPSGLKFILSTPIMSMRNRNEVVAVLNIDSFNENDRGILQSPRFCGVAQGLAKLLASILERDESDEKR